jgi:hypothetical protein
MAKARSWTSLGDAQKKRYIGAARTGKLSGTPFQGSPRQTEAYARKYYESGKSLEGGRGRHAPPGAAPRRETIAALTTGGNDKTNAVLKAWRNSGRVPKWIPTNNAVMADDTAAALSQIGIHPRNWKSVDIRLNKERTAYIMTVKSKRGATRVIALPDRENVSQVAALLRNREGQGRSTQETTNLYSEWEQRNGQPWSIEVEIIDTDPAKRPKKRRKKPKTTPTKALPTAPKRKTKK